MRGQGKLWGERRTRREGRKAVMAKKAGDFEA